MGSMLNLSYKERLFHIVPSFVCFFFYIVRIFQFKNQKSKSIKFEGKIDGHVSMQNGLSGSIFKNKKERKEFSTFIAVRPKLVCNLVIDHF